MHTTWNIGFGAVLLMVLAQLFVDTIRAINDLLHFSFSGSIHLFNMLVAVLRAVVGGT